LLLSGGSGRARHPPQYAAFNRFSSPRFRLSSEPINEALKNDNPDIVTVSKSYREPVCFNTEFNIQRAR
jgi:hypothetical protein